MPWVAVYGYSNTAQCVNRPLGYMPHRAQEASDGCPSGQKMADDAIAHASLRINNGELMLGDSAFGSDVHYAGFTLVLDPSDVAEGQRWFDALAVGGMSLLPTCRSPHAHGCLPYGSPRSTKKHSTNT
ncbi:VOC family protein [Klebsiella pneumoniae]|uniref:VOC family protein n=1 Tax=Klebsiella pneumoniae TaxID=573 RepID=UPI003218E672